MNLAFPDIAAIELYDDGIPFELLARIRDASPVWIEEPATANFGGGPGFWAVASHAGVNQVTQNPQLFSSALGGTTVREARPQDLEQFRHMMLNMDPPRHSKMRKIVNRAFTPQVINQLKASIEVHAREVVDAICERGEIDFLTEAAAEMPLLVLADILGVPAEDRHRLFDWTNTLVAFDDPESGVDPESFRASVLEMFAYASARTLEKRAQPTNDVWSLVVNAEVDGDQLSKGQLDRFFQLLMVAGNETTRNLIAHGLQLLSDYPDQRRRLMADLSLLPAAIEEMLRFAPPVIQFRRTAAMDAELGGRLIRAGDKVLICFAAANRDASVFERPDEFDITRQRNPHLSFGGGTHFCLGANLARLEARVFFAELLTRLPDIRVSGPVVRARSSFINGYRHMPARFTPARRTGVPTPAQDPSQPLTPSSAGFVPTGSGIPTAVARPSATTAGTAGATAAGTTTAVATAAGMTAAATTPSGPSRRHGTSLLVLYGSNFGTAEDLAQRLAADARQHGFSVVVGELDAYAGQLPTEGYLLVVCATYNGTPPDNARAFVEWLEADAAPLPGLAYSVFGCGNSDWAATFQETPRRIDTALERRGARRLSSRGEGDAKDDFDGSFETWAGPLWAGLGRELGMDFGAPVAGPLYSVEVLTGERQRPFVESLGARPMRVAVNRELRTPGPGEAGSTRHIEIDLPPGVSYQAGDHLGVLPQNASALVQRAAARFDLDPDTTIRLNTRDSRETFLPVGERIRLGELLSDYVELQHVATRAQIRTLAAHCECPFTKPRLEALASDAQGAQPDRPGGGADPYRNEVLLKRRSVLDLLDAFPAVQLPLALFLEMLPPLSPRYYSISSSPLHSAQRCSITVGVVSGPALKGQGVHAGVCSNHLAHRGVAGRQVLAFVKDTHSAFRLPTDPRVPVIMVGPGTGVAPFRGFLQERAALRAAGHQVGPSMLFFGCRRPDQDDLYRQELEAFARAGITELHLAFSRAQERKVYVQDLIGAQRERVWALLKAGGVVYVCGDASRMEPEVRATITQVARSCGDMDEVAALAHINRLQTEGRYRVDVWASG